MEHLVAGATGLVGSHVTVDNSKVRRALGIDHRPLEAGLREYFAWERAVVTV